MRKRRKRTSAAILEAEAAWRKAIAEAMEPLGRYHLRDGQHRSGEVKAIEDTDGWPEVDDDA